MAGGELVLVTGGSGFVGAHCIVQLLNKGYRVRTSVRNLSKKPAVLGMLKEGGAKDIDQVEFVAAELDKDEGWADAVRGCTYVLHVASPLSIGVPKTEDEVIIPARDGTLRVLRAARDANVKRVVVTSSFAAVGYGHPPNTGKVLTEKDWSEPKGPDVYPYIKSKIFAERAAWDFIEKEGGSMEMATVNPTAILGPILSKDLPGSPMIVQRLLSGQMPGCPQMQFGIVDVRDVADLHIRAMTDPKAKNERFLAIARGDFMTMQEIAITLKDRLGEKGRLTKTRVLPNFLLKMVALFDPAVKGVLPELGLKKAGTSEKARTLLGWDPRSREDAIVATAESLIKFGIVKV